MKHSVCKTFRIAGITLRMDSDRPIADNREFLPFLGEAESADFTGIFREVQRLPAVDLRVLHEDVCYRVHPDGNGGFVRTFFDASRDRTPYAVAAYDYPNGLIRVDYLEKGKRCLSEIHNCFFHLGFEAMLACRQRLCFHAACVDTPLGGVLFSGPSGVGKSTQAELWCRNRGAKQINGDRPVMSRSEDGWLAWGSPYAGSSGCHINEHCSVTAIVMLRQDPVCHLRRLDHGAAFRAVWSGLTVSSWDAAFVERACDLAMELVDKVPVFEFACTPDTQAVDYLEQALRKECGL